MLSFLVFSVYTLTQLNFKKVVGYKPDQIHMLYIVEILPKIDLFPALIPL